MTRFLAPPLVVRWLVVGALLPTALWAALLLVGAVTESFSSGLEGLEPLVMSIGYLFIIPLYTAVPGAAVGALLGCADRALGRSVERSPHRRRAAAVASTAMSALVLLVALGLQMLWFSAESVLVWVVGSVACAVIPAGICWRRYRRIARSEVSGDGQRADALT